MGRILYNIFKNLLALMYFYFYFVIDIKNNESNLTGLLREAVYLNHTSGFGVIKNDNNNSYNELFLYAVEWE